MATLLNYTYDGLTDQMGDWVLVKKKRLSDTKVINTFRCFQAQFFSSLYC